MSREWYVGEDISCAAIERHSQEVWESMHRHPNICYNLVTSMQRRIGEVVDA